MRNQKSGKQDMFTKIVNIPLYKLVILGALILGVGMWIGSNMTWEVLEVGEETLDVNMISSGEGGSVEAPKPTCSGGSCPSVTNKTQRKECHFNLGYSLRYGKAYCTCKLIDSSGKVIAKSTTLCGE